MARTQEDAGESPRGISRRCLGIGGQDVGLYLGAGVWQTFPETDHAERGRDTGYDGLPPQRGQCCTCNASLHPVAYAQAYLLPVQP
jgi:hypothetical protein